MDAAAGSAMHVCRIVEAPSRTLNLPRVYPVIDVNVWVHTGDLGCLCAVAGGLARAKNLCAHLLVLMDVCRRNQACCTHA